MRCFCISITAKEQSGLFVSQKERTSLHLKANINASSLKRRMMRFRFRLTNECDRVALSSDNISYNKYRFGYLQKVMAVQRTRG